jgi:hypothetical protein
MADAPDDDFALNLLGDGISIGKKVAMLALPQRKNLEKAWIHKALGKASRYYVTNTGIQLVETKFGQTK